MALRESIQFDSGCSPSSWVRPRTRRIGREVAGDMSAATAQLATLNTDYPDSLDST